jgi:hypothetical protein
MPLHEVLILSQGGIWKRAARRGRYGSGGEVGRLGCRSSGRDGSRARECTGRGGHRAGEGVGRKLQGEKERRGKGANRTQRDLVPSGR